MSLSYNPIMLAMDFAQESDFDQQLDQLHPYINCFKIGLQAMHQFGTKTLVDKIHARDCSVFLDGKFCDIPNTVGKASQVVSDMGVAFFNVHANCGPQAIEAAAEHKQDSKLLAVTVLTSIDDKSCQSIFGQASQDKVLQFAQDALNAGADGVVCSPLELKLFQQNDTLKQLIKVCPGIRPQASTSDDQKRTLSPKQAIEAGADHLVIGRPITQAQDSIQACKDILQSIN